MQNTRELINQIDNPELDLAFNFVQFTNRNIFLTGKAGTGKTTFLRNLKKVSPKRMIIVAPTGVAAMNAGGVTIHSFFQLPFGPFIPSSDNENGDSSRKNIHKFNKDKINIIKTLDLLVIDEISMVRADLLDGIDDVLRRYKDKSKPFGGVQLLMIGDIQQLSPVIKEEEWNFLKEWYSSVYFFSSRSLLQTQYISIELKHIYRQSDSYFIGLLNKVRENKIDAQTLNELNKRYNPRFTQNTPEGYIFLTTHIQQSQKINQQKLQQLKNKVFNFTATIQGDFPEYTYPTDYELSLKIGAQVMFIKNDTSRDKLYYNGKIGIIEKFDADTIYVKCKEDLESIPVLKAEFKNTKFTINEETREIEENVSGSFIQYPLKLAWAITIHKSQGLTFENAIIDANSAFAFGQVYVALSRCKTLEGMILSSKLSFNSIKSDLTVQSFSRDIELNPPSIDELKRSKYDYQKSLILELIDFSQIKQQLMYCLKLCKDNINSLHAGLKVSLELILECLNTDLLEIADKFKPQIVRLLELEPDAEKNHQLNERIIKASIYFVEKIESNALKIILNTTVLSENKELKKTLSNLLVKSKMDLLIKLACFNKCKDGFNVKAYLDIRGKSAIEISLQQPSKEAKEEVLNSNSINHPELFKILNKWRNQKAKDLGKATHRVLRQRSLIEIVEQLPSSIEELKLINRIGKQNIKAFGNEILAIVVKYCKDNSIIKEPKK